MTTPNTFPAPIGVTVAFTNLKAGQTTPNFTLDGGGLYVVSLEMADTRIPGDKVSLQQVVGSNTNNVFDMVVSGYYNYVSPTGVGTIYNFTTVNDIKNVRITRVRLSLQG